MKKKEVKIIFGYDSPELLPTIPVSQPLTKEELLRRLHEEGLEDTPEEEDEEKQQRDSSKEDE